MLRLTLDQISLGIGLLIVLLTIVHYHDLDTTKFGDHVRRFIMGYPSGVEMEFQAGSVGGLAIFLAAYAILVRESNVSELEKKLTKEWLFLSIFVSYIFVGLGNSNETERKLSWVFTNFVYASFFVLPIFLFKIKA